MSHQKSPALRPPALAANHRPFRLLVVSNETVEGEALHAVIVGLASARAAEVFVVAPALNGRIRHWLSDEDQARQAAEIRLKGCLERLRGDGVTVIGAVGDANPLLAIEDALRIFPADALLIATHPEERSNWIAHDLVERARVRFGLPTSHVVIDIDNDRPGISQLVTA